MARVVVVPGTLVEWFLLGRASPGELQRFTQDAGIVADVWLTFAQDLNSPQRVLLAPVDGVPATEVAALLHDALRRYRADPAQTGEIDGDLLLPDPPPSRAFPSVSPLESFVAVTLYFDELIRVVLPLTHWWRSKGLDAVRDKEASAEFRDNLETHIAQRLGPLPSLAQQQAQRPLAAPRPMGRSTDGKILEATSIVALIGLMALAARDPDALTPLSSFADKPADQSAWTQEHAELIARAAVRELRRPALSANVSSWLTTRLARGPAPALVQRVFLDRASHLADAEAVCTVKADAATRVFNISCRNLTWAVLDSGVAASHPAFDEFDTGADGRPVRTGRSRVRATYDLTLVDRIRNFDLVTENTEYRDGVILDIIRDLRHLPGQRAADFDKIATANLRAIAVQLKQRLLPDWGLIEPLIRIDRSEDADLRSDHGTHVAGILAGDWREPTAEATGEADEEVVLQGVCPDISIYDLRVIHPGSMKNTEFAVIAALEFVRYLNSRAAGPPLIHGVNISLSIPHEVRNYGCGVTPICQACDDLVQAGVVVVAAAGNRGWNEREIGFGNFVFCSITDPGNAQRVITVGATHRAKPHTYGVSYFSSRGPTGDGRSKPDLVAPGEKIRGPVRGGADDELDGTSMAAPFVSGAAAMLMARNRELMGNPQRIKELLCENATDLGRERYFQGHGLVDVLRALQGV